MENYKKPDRLERVEQKLYSPDSDIRQKPRHQIYGKEYSIPKDWTQDENQKIQDNPLKIENKKGFSFFTKFLLVAFLFFLGAISYAFFMFYYRNAPDLNNVDITINSPVSVSAGEQFNYDIIVANNNKVKMETVDLVIEYPEGTRDGKDVAIDMPRERSDIGFIESGSYKRETRSVFLFGETGDIKEISVKVVYRSQDSNAIFEKTKVVEVLLKSTPIRMNISSISEVTSGQNLEFDAEIISNSNERLDNIVIKAEYPFGFSFGSSNLPAQKDNNTWVVEKLDPKEVIKFKIKGQIQGQNNEERFFKFSAGLLDKEKENEIGVLFTSIGKTIMVARPFLEIDLAIDESKSSVINLSPDTSYQAKVNYKNNTDAPIKDVNIVMQIDGAVLDENSVQASRGFYQSADNTITWDKTTYADFEELGVGKSGILEFNFRSKSLVGTERFKNPEISINAKVKGNRYSDQNVPEEIVNEIFKKIRFDTQVDFLGKSSFNTGPFQNSGPIPPKVDNETTYTISFAVSNSSNKITNGVMEMKLPNYVSFKDQTWPTGVDIKYDQRDRKVIWSIGEIKEGTGYDQSQTNASFQVGIIPSLSQKNSSAVLVDSIVFTGNDLFTGRQIRTISEDISTSISDGNNFYDGQITQ